MNVEDSFDRALNGDELDRRAAASVQALVDVATEVTQALRAPRLSRGDQDRIYARSLALLESAVIEQRNGWQRALRMRRPLPILVGGAAALTLGAAAVGWAVLHERRSREPLAA